MLSLFLLCLPCSSHWQQEAHLLLPNLLLLLFFFNMSGMNVDLKSLETGADINHACNPQGGVF